jgi:hypothetical protein
MLEILKKTTFVKWLYRVTQDSALGRALRGRVSDLAVWLRRQRPRHAAHNRAQQRILQDFVRQIK